MKPVHCSLPLRRYVLGSTGLVRLALCAGIGLPLVLGCLGGTPAAIVFNQNFEGGALGKVEQLGEDSFRCHVPGQSDEHGRNRQANWYYFRLQNVQDRQVTVTLTDFVGEYNGKPGACAMNASTIPVFSEDNEHWQHFPAMAWDEAKKEAILKFRPKTDAIWIAHVPPYTHSRLLRLLGELDRRPWVRVEAIGRTVQGRELPLVTVGDFDRPEAAKRTVWLQARQHAWETGTSFVMEGALRYIASEEARARELRGKLVFKFVPMMDPDGCAAGKVRFNANGYDVNRHWDEVDLRHKEFLEWMPEIWYVKKAIFAAADAGPPIGLMLNMHNTETGEYLASLATDTPTRALMQRLFDRLQAGTTFDPAQPLVFDTGPDATTNSLYRERAIPVLLMEQRISPSPKLGRRLESADRLEFGRQLIIAMAETVIE